MPHFLDDPITRRVCIQYTFRRGLTEYEAMRDLRKSGDGEHEKFPVKYEEVQFWFGRFRSGNFDLRFEESLEVLEEEERELAEQKLADQVTYEVERDSEEEEEAEEEEEEEPKAEEESVENQSFLQELLTKLDLLPPKSTIDEIWIHANSFEAHNIVFKIRYDNYLGFVTYKEQANGCLISWTGNNEDYTEENYQKVAMKEILTVLEHCQGMQIKVLQMNIEPGDEFKEFLDKFLEELRYAKFDYSIQEFHIQNFVGTLMESFKTIFFIKNCRKLSISRDSFGDEDIVEMMRAVKQYNWEFRECTIKTIHKIDPIVGLISRIEKFDVVATQHEVNIKISY